MSTNRTPGLKRHVELSALEPRMLFDGAALISWDAATAAPQAPPPADAPASAGPVQIVFISPEVADPAQIRQAFGATAEVIELAAGRDGIDQISDILAARHDVAAIHLISHGSDAFIALPGQALSSATLDARAAQVAAWSHALTADADILVYGCDVAAGQAGVALAERLAALTGADVAASSNDSGGTAGADWTLEYRTGAIAAPALFSPGLGDGASYANRLATINLSGSTGWTTIMKGPVRDPFNDTQAGAADTDIIGDATHGSLYTAYDDKGTAATGDDTLVFRMRIDNPTSVTNFSGVAIVGMDANRDGRVDLFFSVDGRNNGQAVRLLDPGTGANVSPNTTSTSALPTGWLPNNGVYAFSPSNYSVVAVSAATDSDWAPAAVPAPGSSNSNLTGANGTDVFINWRVPIADIAIVLAKPSATDRSGVAGPRGAGGIANYGKDTVVQYISFTQTQTGPINGDLNGVGAAYDKNATFAALGAFTSPMSAANPVPDGLSITINEPVGDGKLAGASGATEAAAVTLSGGTKAAAGATVSLVITDSGAGSTNASATVVAGVNGLNTWSVSNVNLSGLAEGTLSVAASVTESGSTATDTATVVLDKTAPLVAINPLATTTAGTPTLSGTSDLPDGAVVTLTLDPDNNPATANVLYQVVVAGGAWTLNTATATPLSGSLPAGGLTPTTKITASAIDAAGNVGSAVGLNRPTVTSQSTGSTSPTIGGSWTNVAGDTLTVKLYTNNAGNPGSLLATYTLVPAGNSWSVDLASAIKDGGGTVGALAPDQTYQIVAEVTRGGATVADTTSGELVIIGGPSIDIVDNDGVNDDNVTVTVPKPTFAGTSSVLSGFITVSIDPTGNGTTDRITYSVQTDASGNWSLDTSGPLQPVAGAMPVAGLSGSAVVVASTPLDASGQSASNTQNLSVVIPGITIGTAANNLTGIETTIANGGSLANIITGDGIFNMAEDDSVIVSGTTTNVAQGSSVVITISDGTLDYTKTAVVAANGTFTLLSSGAGTANDGNAFDLSALNSAGLTVTATVLGTSAQKAIIHDKIAPQIVLTTPSIIKTSSPVVTGNANLPAGSVISLVTDYPQTGLSATVDANGDFSTTLSLSSNGTVKITASSSATDLAGNKVANAEQTVAYQTPNVNPPVVTISGITGTGSGDTTITSSDILGGVTISGTFANTKTTASGTLTLSITDGVHTKTNADTGVTLTRNINGTWSAVLTEAVVKSFNNGPLIVKAQLTDTVGSGAGTFYTVSDVTQPTLLLVTGTPSVSITEVVDANGLVNATEDDSVTIRGRAVNAAGGEVKVTVSDGDNATVDPTATATVADDGSWSVTGMNLSALNDGTLTVAAVVDPDRNPATSDSASTSTTTVHDKTAPVLNITAAASVANNLPLITGTSAGLAAGATVTVTINSDRTGAVEATYSTTVQADGSWRVQSAIPTPADSIIIATASDPAGNAASVAATSIMAISPDSGTPADFITNQRNLTFSGSAALGATVTLRLNGTVIGTPVADPVTGVWTFDFSATSLANGSYTLTAATTVNGNGALSTQTIVIDAQALAIGGISADSGAGADFLTSDTTLVFNGSATTGAMVSVTLEDASGAEVFRQLASAAGGAWSVDRSLDAALGDGSYTLRAAVTDASGVTSTVSRAIVIDTRADIGITTNYKTADTSPVLRGTTDIEVGRAIAVDVAISGGGTLSYTTTVAPDGTWSIDTGDAVPAGSGGPVAFSNGAQLTITASGTDLAGNSASSSKAMVIDIAAPAIAITTELDYTGSNTPNGILVASEDTSVILRGSTSGVPDGATLSITITDGVTTLADTATVSANAWQLAPANLRGLANGTITVTATYLDAGGTPYVAVATVLHDKSIAGANATIDSISTDSAIAGDFITSDNTLLFRGSAAPGALVKLVMTGPGAGGNVFANGLTVTADGAGNWSYDFQGSTLADGSYALSAQVGLGAVATQTVIVDTAAPNGPVSVVHPLVTSDSTPQISGSVTLGAGETLAVTVNGKTYLAGDGRLSVTGATWTLAIPEADALTPASAGAGFDGVYQVVATIRDVAGNILADSSSNELTVQDLAAPVIDLAPSNGATLDRSVASVNGGAVSLDDGADPLTLVDASNRLLRLTLAVGGLAGADGASEKLVFGGTVVAADGSDSVTTRTDIMVGGVRVNLSYAAGVFSIQRYDFAAMSAAEAQAVARDISYRNDAGAASTLGARTFAFSARDDAGNAAASATATVNVSTNANVPAQTVIITSIADDVAPVIGTVANGGATNDAAPALAGTISAGLGANEVVGVYRNGVRLGDATVSGTGWTYADSGLADATHSYTAQVENSLAGTAGTASGAYAIVLDTGAPAQNVTIVSMTRDSGTPGDFITTDGAAGRTVTGTLGSTLANGEVLELSFDGGANWVVASVDGTGWTALDAGVHTGNWTITTRIVDAAGNTGGAATQNVVLQGAAGTSVAITAVTDDVARVTGIIASGGVTNDNAPAISGTLSAPLGANEIVSVLRDGVKIGNASVSGATWSFTDSALVNGATYSYTARIDNTATPSTGTPSNAYTIVVDTAAPAQGVAIAAMTRDSGIAGDFITSDGAAGRVVSGTLTAPLGTGDVLEISHDGGVTWSLATVTGSAWASTDSAAHAAGWTISARIVDSAGNVGPAVSRDVILSGAPVQTVAVTAIADDVAALTGTVASGGVTNDTAPGVSGTISAPLGANEVLAVYRNGTRIGNASVLGGAWTFADGGLLDGASYSYTAQVENLVTTLAGSASGAYAVSIDASAPAQGVVIVAMTRDSGIAGDFVTGDGGAGRVVTGTLSSVLGTGEVLQASFDDGASWVVASVSGTGWSALDAAAHSANWTITTRIVDAAGNTGGAAARAVVLQADPVQAVGISSITDDAAPSTGTVASGGISNDTTPLLAGTLALALAPGANEVVAVYRDGTRIGNASVSGAAWTYADSGLADGATYAYTARVENSVTGINSTASAPYSITIDLGAPAQSVTITTVVDDVGPVTGTVANGGATNDSAPGVSGALSAALGPNEVLAVYRNGVRIGTASVTGTAWSYADSALADGASVSYTARVENSATGRAGVPSAGYALRIDTSAPAQTVTIETMERDTDAAGDFITSDGGAGRTVSGTVSAPLAAGELLEVSFDGGASWVPATVGGTGWNAPDTGAHGGNWSIVTRLTDAAGNAGGASTRAVTLTDTGIVFTPDTLPAAEPLLGADANSTGVTAPVAPVIVDAPVAPDAAPAQAPGPAPLDSAVLAPGMPLVAAGVPSPVLASGLRATGLLTQEPVRVSVFEIETGNTATGTSRVGESFNPSDIGAGFSINVRQADGSAADKDTVRLVSAVVRIDDGLVPQRDQLALTVSSPNITSVFDAATGTMVLSGGASVTEYEKVIRGLKLRDADGSDVKAKRTIRFTIKSEAGQVQQGAKEYRGPEAALEGAPPRPGGSADAGEAARPGKTGLVAQIANAHARQTQGRDQLLALAARQR
ncbi:Ig-like domain-containing protein [Massilia violaceinigra]|nr:Ig-like domain-containing protein [Massilia violaceinigra]